VAAWFWYAVVAVVLYGAHQTFTRLPADRIGEGPGGFVVDRICDRGTIFAAQIASQAAKLRDSRGIPRTVSMGVLM
jgi:hypothetical protein